MRRIGVFLRDCGRLHKKTSPARDVDAISVIFPRVESASWRGRLRFRAWRAAFSGVARKRLPATPAFAIIDVGSRIRIQAFRDARRAARASPRMTDAELLQLIEQVPPEFWTEEQVETLRERIAHAPELRTAFADQLRIENLLAATYGGGNISAASILEKSSIQPRRPPRHWARWTTGLLVIAILAAGAAWQFDLLPFLHREPAVAVNEKEIPQSPGGKTGVGTNQARRVDVDPDELDSEITHVAAVDPSYRQELEAESFSSGNVAVRRTGEFPNGRRFGRRGQRAAATACIYGPEHQRYYVEYDVTLPQAAAYRFVLRYTAGDSRPLIASINGKVVNPTAVAAATASWEPSALQWAEVGVYEFKTGRNTIRLEAPEDWTKWTDNFFPLIDRLAIEHPSREPPVAIADATKSPWESARQLGAPPRPYRTLAFEDVSETAADFTPKADELRRWFGAQPGHQLNINERDFYGRRCGTFEGRACLQCPWPDDALLRFAVADANKLRIYCWSGDTGVLLQFHEDRRFVWAAYAVTRDAAKAKTNSWTLVSTDEDRSYRTSPSGFLPLELYWRESELVLARGAIPLLVAPLATPPREVIFDGRAAIRGLAIVHATEFPSAESLIGKAAGEKPANVAAADRPGRTWRENLAPGAHRATPAPGTIELAAMNAKDLSQLTTPLTDAGQLPGIVQVTCHLSQATPGASVFLCGDDDRPTDVLRIMKESRSGALGAWFVNHGDGRVEANEDFNNGPVPLFHEDVWLRFVSGGGMLRAWTSGDGVHWGAPWEVRAHWGLTPARFGIALAPAKELRSIRVSQLEVRALPALAALAPIELRRRLPALDAAAHDPGKLIEWLGNTGSRKPAEVDQSAWRCAAAYQALAAGATLPTSRTLLGVLLDRALSDKQLSLTDKLNVLREASLIANVWDDASAASEIMDRYLALATAAIEPPAAPNEQKPTHRVYMELADAMLESPLALRQSALPPLAALARLELLDLVATKRWAELAELTQVLAFRDVRPFYAPAESTIVDWGKALAQKNLRGDGARETAAFRSAWRNPFVEQISTEAFNVLAEFRAALESESYRDAAATIASAGDKLVGNTESLGVLPDDKDPDLYVSLRVALASAMQDHPALGAAMGEHFGPTARLRVDRAIAEGNDTAVEAATLQFHGTEAAADAHLWLGNRALGVGEFARALGHFRVAAESSAPRIANEAASRVRLASALLGQMAAAGNDALKINAVSLPADELHRIAQRGAAMRVQGDAPVASHAAAPQRTLPPGDYRLQSWGDFAIGSCPRPNLDSVARDVSINWTQRNTSIVAAPSAAGDLVLVTGRYSTTALDPATGAKRWDAVLPKERAEPGDWPAVVRRPLVVGSRILVRWIAKNGPCLACIDAKTGNLRWQSQHPSQELVASDPFWSQEELIALVARHDDIQQQWTISLATFDVDTGETVRTRPLVRLRTAWRELGVCELAMNGDTIVATFAGVFVCCDLSGQLRWIRTAQVIPANIDRWTLIQAAEPPLILDGRIYLASPAVRQLRCIDAATGRMLWQRAAPNLIQSVGLYGKLFVALEQDSLFALDAATGALQWRLPVGDDFTPLLYDQANPTVADSASAKIVAWERAPASPPMKRGDAATLVWIDAATGKRTAAWHDPDRSAIKTLGPAAIAATGRLWALAARDPNTDVRQIVEFLPPGVKVAEPAPLKPPPGDPAADKLMQVVAATFSGWTATSGRTDLAAPLVKHLESDNTLVALADHLPVVFTREIALAKNEKRRLRIKAGFAAKESWHLRVTAGDRQLADAQIGGQDQPGWQRFELDLAPFAGKSVKLEVTATSPEGKPRKTFWKRLIVE
jgi:outer membrane protein assembly factor BamB